MDTLERLLSHPSNITITQLLDYPTRGVPPPLGLVDARKIQRQKLVDLDP